MDPQPRTFTREEAEALLPQLDQLLGEAQAVASRLTAAEQGAQADQWKPRTNGKVQPQPTGEPPEATRRALGPTLNRLVERIQALGVVVRDIASGLIDFPCERDDRIVHLCWRRGEPFQIRFWHEVDAGFAGRQPL